MMVLERSDTDATVVNETAIVEDKPYQQMVDEMINDEKMNLDSDWEYNRDEYQSEMMEKVQEQSVYEDFKQKIESDLDDGEILQRFEEQYPDEYESAKEQAIDMIVEQKAEEWNSASSLSEYFNQNY